MRKILAASTAGLVLAFLAFLATPANATTASPTSQLVFDDYRATVYSVEVVGTNQNGNHADSCWTTPLTVNLIPGWWWAGDTKVLYFTSNNCSSGRIGTLTLTDTPTDPPYHCLEDVTPFSDWNPGNDWTNCRIPGKTPFNGDAISTHVWG